CQNGLIECDGTCVDPDTDRNYCGATAGCGEGSGSDGEVCGAGSVCQAGSCVLSCPSGLVACGSTCVDPDTDRNYCGATAGCGESGQGTAGETCDEGEVCSGGSCALSCQAGLIECNGTCIDPDSSRQYCGATEGCGENGGTAGMACDAGEICESGECVISCPGSLIACDDTCVNPNTDRNHCGATEGCGEGAGDAGEVCDAGEICVAGTCTLSCPAPLVACGGTCIDPDTNADYCGASGDCQGANAGVACGAEQECVDGECEDAASGLHENCREENGLIWCG